MSRPLAVPILAVLAGCAALLAATPATAVTIEPEAVDCLPVEANRAVRATVEAGAGTRVRLNFRRLHPAGAFYWVRMTPEGEGVYRAVVPRPERRDQTELDDRWWEVLATRDWMAPPERDRDWLERWLQERELEAAELYVTVVDAEGRQLERSEVQLVEVLEPDRCEVELDPIERGQAANQTVGESTRLQAQRPLFHWLCYGIVTRISAAGIARGDEHCRACVVAFRPRCQAPA